MKLLRFDTAMWVLSLGGLATIITYFVASTQLGVDLPFEVALLGVGLISIANGLLFIHWSSDLFGFVKKKEYLAAVMMLLLGLLAFNGFWLR